MYLIPLMTLFLSNEMSVLYKSKHLAFFDAIVAVHYILCEFNVIIYIANSIKLFEILKVPAMILP